MPRPISYVVFCLKKKQRVVDAHAHRLHHLPPRHTFHFFPLRRPPVSTLFPDTTLFRSSCAYTQGKREQFSGFNRTLDAINNVFRKFSAFHDETGRLNVDGMNIISNDGSNKLNRSRKARVSDKVQRTINASLNAATSTRAVSSNPNFVTRQKIEIIFGYNHDDRSLNEHNRGQSGLETYGLFSHLTHDFLPTRVRTASDSDSNPRSFKMSTRKYLPRTKCDS